MDIDIAIATIGSVLKTRPHNSKTQERIDAEHGVASSKNPIRPQKTLRSRLRVFPHSKPAQLLAHQARSRKTSRQQCWKGSAISDNLIATYD